MAGKWWPASAPPAGERRSDLSIKRHIMERGQDDRRT
jgi:hypothetical protein